MVRFLSLTCVLACAGMVSLAHGGDPPPKMLTPVQFKDLEEKRLAKIAAGLKAYREGKYAEATRTFEEGLELARRLYSRAMFPAGHGNLAATLNNVAFMYKLDGRFTDAEPLVREALAINRRIFPGDHPVVALGYTSLAQVCLEQGKYAEAERYFQDGLDINKRLFTDDHSDLALSLGDVAQAYYRQGKYADAEPLDRQSLEMNRRLFKGNHELLAASISNLASCYQGEGKLVEAEALFREAHDMNRRLSEGDDPRVALSLRNLGSIVLVRGKIAEAETLSRDSLDMMKRLYSTDHPQTVAALDLLARLYHQRGRYAESDPLSLDAVRMSRRLAQVYAVGKTEGETIGFLATLSVVRDDYLVNARRLNAEPERVYAEIWTFKGMLAHAYEQRRLALRIAASNPTLTDTVTQLVDARRRRTELILAAASKDATVRQKRNEDLRSVEATIADFERKIGPLLPASARTEPLDTHSLRDLQKVLPADAAVVDFLRVGAESDRDTPAAGRVLRYQAFAVTRSTTAWLDLAAAETIEKAVAEWRAAIATGMDVPPALAVRVRALVWEKVRKELPAWVKTVYVCPDAALCRVPWGALSGDKPGTILLEDFAVATVPHAPFLLDKLGETRPSTRTTALVVGGVNYDAAPARSASLRGEPLVPADRMLAWSFLPGTLGEVNGVIAAAERKRLEVARLEGDRATSAAVLASLRRARHAHIATHGFFADPAFRSVFQLEPRDYEYAAWGERMGKAAQCPFVMTGLVLAGANLPATPGRGIVTGESIIDLDLSGLDLAVLSVCETGLGDVAGGEGTFGLQRAFHLAGARDVVASLWKAPDQGTAAVMALFYRNLWDKNLSPMESLRQAQVELYRNPGRVGELATGFRGKFAVATGSGGDVPIASAKDGTAHPLLWAAFILSGP